MQPHPRPRLLHGADALEKKRFTAYYESMAASSAIVLASDREVGPTNARIARPCVSRRPFACDAARTSAGYDPYSVPIRTKLTTQEVYACPLRKWTKEQIEAMIDELEP